MHQHLTQGYSYRMKILIFATILAVIYLVSTVVPPGIMLVILGVIIITIPILMWGSEMKKGFKNLREREDDIKIRRAKLEEK